MFTKINFNLITFVNKILFTFVTQTITVMNTRLQQFLSAENITQAQFADSIKVARAGVSHIIAGRNKPGYDFILSMMKRYPDLNIEWLMTGKGKMYKSASPAALSAPRQNNGPESSLPVGEEDNVFSTSSEEGLFALRDEDISAVGDVQDAYNESSGTPDSPAGPEEKPEIPVRQRKATKIIVFFDDNTFQEFQQ